MFFGPGYGLYILFSLPALLLGLWAQAKVKGAFNKYSRVRTANGMTGAEVARRILNANGLQDVQIEMINGMLSDHYDPSKRVLRLSQAVYQGNSVASAGVAAHESGHALQHQAGYAPLALRSAIVPAVQIGSWLGPIIFIVGLLLSRMSGNLTIAWIGLLLFSATAVFSIVTLPVEFNASARAKEWLQNTGIVYQTEMQGVNAVLDAAALTYVAAAVQAVSTILYYLFLIMGSSSRRS